jgi:hypothetical protein
MKHTFRRALNTLSALRGPFGWEEILLFIVIAGVFVVNALYVAYPDEYVNILAGKAINEGKYAYSGFFDHHLPMAWYIAASLLKLTFNNFVLFRVAWALLVFFSFLVLGAHLRKSNPGLYPYFLFYFFIYPFFAVYFWLHLYIGDALATFFFSLTFWITLNETFKERVSIRPLLMASFLNFCLLFSSLTFLYMTAALYTWQLWLTVREGWNWRRPVAFLMTSASPYVIFLVHLLVTGTLRDFWISNFYYNTQHYVGVRNYPVGTPFHPVKFALTIVYNFTNDYMPLISKIKELNLWLPILNVAAWGTLLMGAVLLFRDRVAFLCYLGILVFSAPRSTISKYAETDYQMGMFLTLGLVSSLAVLYQMNRTRLQDSALDTLKRAGGALLGIFLLFTTVFLVKNTFDKAYQRYLQIMPSISNRSFVSEFVDEIIEPGEYFWIGPYQPEHVFPVKEGRLPGKFPTMLPQFRESELFSQEFLRQFEENPPTLIIFKHESSVFNTPADIFGKFFLDWMDGKYMNLEDLPEYRQLRSPTEINLKGDVYVRVDQQEEMLQRLQDAGYVERL